MSLKARGPRSIAQGRGFTGSALGPCYWAPRRHGPLPSHTTRLQVWGSWHVVMSLANLDGWQLRRGRERERERERERGALAKERGYLWHPRIMIQYLRSYTNIGEAEVTVQSPWIWRSTMFKNLRGQLLARATTSFLSSRRVLCRKMVGRCLIRPCPHSCQKKATTLFTAAGYTWRVLASKLMDNVTNLVG